MDRRRTVRRHAADRPRDGRRHAGHARGRDPRGRHARARRAGVVRQRRPPPSHWSGRAVAGRVTAGAGARHLRDRHRAGCRRLGDASPSRSARARDGGGRRQLRPERAAGLPAQPGAPGHPDRRRARARRRRRRLGRGLRLQPPDPAGAGRAAVVVRVDGLDSRVVAADASGGLWFGAIGDEYMAHVDAAGAVRRFPLPRESRTLADDVAGAPDGSAVYAFDDCTLVRVTSAGVGQRRAPADPRLRGRLRRAGRAVARRTDAGRAARRGRVGRDV